LDGGSINRESQQHIVGLSAQDSKIAAEQEQHSTGDCARAHVNRSAVLGVDAVDRLVSLATGIEVPELSSVSDLALRRPWHRVDGKSRAFCRRQRSRCPKNGRRPFFQLTRFMADAGHSGSSRSLAIYGVLLELYPREYLQQHRAEMLQNFEDLERASSSRAALWLFIGRDLAISLGGRFTRTLSGQTALLLLVLAILIVETPVPGQGQLLRLPAGMVHRMVWQVLANPVSGSRLRLFQITLETSRRSVGCDWPGAGHRASLST
jgi:hypothetical protein